MVERVSGGAAQPVAGASVQVNSRSGGAATVYGSEAGGTTIANPLTTDTSGEISGWVDEGSYNLVISGTSITTRTVPIELVRGDSSVSIGTAKIADNAITTAKIADNAVVTAKIPDNAITPAKLASNTSLVPTGTIFAYAGTAAPAGYLLCDGTSYTATAQNALYNVIGAAYGGSGSNFNVPDLRGRFPIGKGTNSAVDLLGKNEGAAVASRQPQHQHAINPDGAHSHSVADHSHFVPAHSHTIAAHSHSVLGATTDIPNASAIAPLYSTIWGYAYYPGVNQTSTSGGIAPAGNYWTKGTQQSFGTGTHQHGLNAGTTTQGAYQTSSDSPGYSGGATPGTSGVSDHSHGGITGSANIPYLVINWIIKN